MFFLCVQYVSSFFIYSICIETYIQNINFVFLDNGKRKEMRVFCFANVCFVKFLKYFGRAKGCLHFFLYSLAYIFLWKNKVKMHSINIQCPPPWQQQCWATYSYLQLRIVCCVFLLFISWSFGICLMNLNLLGFFLFCFFLLGESIASTNSCEDRDIIIMCPPSKHL